MNRYTIVDFQKQSFNSLNEVPDFVKSEYKRLSSKNLLYDKETEIIFLIHLEQNYLKDDKGLFSLEGIELLKWLRVNKIFNHCIITSFLSLIEVVQNDPINIVAILKGTTFIQLPSRISFDDVLSKKNFFYANETELRQLFRTEIDISVIRHEEANWWGLYRNILIKNAISKSSGKPELNIPGEIAENLRTIQHKVADFLFNEDESKITSVLQNQKVRLKPDDPVYIKNIKSISNGQEVTLRQKAEYFEKALKENKIKCLQIDDKANNGWSYFLRNVLYENTSNNLFEVVEPKNDFDDIESIKKEVDSKIRLLDPDVILLDLKLLKKHDVLVDKVENLSGAKILKDIRNNHSAIPIIVTSASNKIWSYTEVIKLGADAYWIKEGIDEQRTILETAENYLELLRLIYFCSKGFFGDVKDIDSAAKKTFATTNPWWENKNWNFEYYYGSKTIDNLIIPQFSKCSSEEIKEIIFYSIKLLRNYLSSKYLGYSYNSYEEKEWFIASLVIQHIAKVIEAVHGFNFIKENEKRIDKRERRRIGKVFLDRFYDSSGTIDCFDVYFNRKSEKIIRRGDNLGKKLLEIRHESSHYAKSLNTTIHSAKEYCNDIFNYLKNEPKISHPTIETHIETKTAAGWEVRKNGILLYAK